MPDRNFSKTGYALKILQFAFVAAGFSLLSLPAHAGFQWVAPPEAPASAQPMPPPGAETLSTAPSVSSAPEPITPTIISPESTPAPAPMAMPAPAPAPIPAPMPSSAPPAQNGQAPEVISPIVIEGQGSPSANTPPPVPLEQATFDSQQGTAPLAAPPSMPPAPPADNVTVIGAGNPPPPPSDNVIMQSPSPSPAPTAGIEMPPYPMPAPPQETASAPPSPPAPPPAPMAAAVPSAPMDDNAPVQGFANNVPLAVALREVLPPGYGFSIDQDVDLGTQVSFQGGKPWRETLAGMLQPAGLTMREEGVMVAIGRTQSMQMASAAPPSMPPSLALAPPQPAAPPSAPPPQEAMVVAPQPQPAMAPPPRIEPTPSADTPLWNGKPVSGPKPLLTQPAVPSLPPPAPPPLVSSLKVTAAPTVDTWTAARGDTLHKVLETWSNRAHAEFQWSAEYDYPLQASVSFTGTFEDAVRSLLSGFEEAHPQPVAELHDNSEAGQMVLVVQTRGNSYTD